MGLGAAVKKSDMTADALDRYATRFLQRPTTPDQAALLGEDLKSLFDMTKAIADATTANAWLHTNLKKLKELAGYVPAGERRDEVERAMTNASDEPRYVARLILEGVGPRASGPLQLRNRDSFVELCDQFIVGKVAFEQAEFRKVLVANAHFAEVIPDFREITLPQIENAGAERYGAHWMGRLDDLIESALKRARA